MLKHKAKESLNTAKSPQEIIKILSQFIGDLGFTELKKIAQERATKTAQ